MVLHLSSDEDVNLEPVGALTQMHWYFIYLTMNTDLDFEKVAQDKSILKELEKDCNWCLKSEIIYISALVVKYNHVDKKQ